MRFAIFLKVFHAVFQPNFVRFQKTVEFVLCFETKQTAELGRRDLVFAIGFESEGFNDRAGQFETGSGKG